MDPLVQAPASSQSLNPYSYVLNNPLAGTDPTGFASCWDEGDCKALGPARQAFTEKAEFAIGGQVIQGGGPAGNGHLKDPLAMSPQEYQAAIFRDAAKSGSLGQRSNFGLNGEIGYPGQETERGTWYGGIVVYPDHLETYWDVKVRLERNNRLALADALVAADGRAIVGMQARTSAVAAVCAVTAGGCAAYGLYSAKKDYDAGNTKMAAAGLALTALGAGAVTAELRGVRMATAEVQAAAVEVGVTAKSVKYDVDAMARAAAAPDRGGLTRAGRALDKHGAGQRSATSPFPAPRGGPADKNAAGQFQVEDILTHPNSVFTPLGRGGVGVRSPDGREIRFDADGRFAGFIE